MEEQLFRDLFENEHYGLKITLEDAIKYLEQFKIEARNYQDKIDELDSSLGELKEESQVKEFLELKKTTLFISRKSKAEKVDFDRGYIETRKYNSLVEQLDDSTLKSLEKLYKNKTDKTIQELNEKAEQLVEGNEKVRKASEYYKERRDIQIKGYEHLVKLLSLVKLESFTVQGIAGLFQKQILTKIKETSTMHREITDMILAIKNKIYEFENSEYNLIKISLDESKRNDMTYRSVMLEIESPIEERPSITQLVDKIYDNIIKGLGGEYEKSYR